MSKASIRTILNGETAYLIRRLIADHGYKFRRQYAFVLFCMLMIAGTTATSAFLMRDVINKVFIEMNQTAVWLLSLTIVVIYAIKGTATYGQQTTLTKIANAIVASCQRRLFRHMMDMDIRFFTERHSAEILSRQGMMASSCGSVLNTVVITIGRDLLSLIGLVSVMVLQDPLMSLVGLLIIPAAAWGVNKLVSRSKAIMRRNFDLGVNASHLSQETVRGIRVVKTFCLEDVMRERFEETTRELEQNANKLATVGARSTPLMETLGGVAVAIVILYGGWQVVSKHQTPGVFFSFITALLLAYEPAKRLARVHIDLASNLVGVRMMYDFLETPAVEGDESDLPALVIDRGRIAFDAVDFYYRAGEKVLSDLSLICEAGKTTALVGRSGGGKSTILSVLLRFYEITGGSISIDGTDIRNVKRTSLRSKIAYVGQDIFLFNASIYDNISFGRPGATRSEVEAAARAAFAHDFIMGFPEGYASKVGENGIQLSGGQRQRVAIARAILKDAPILLLDEATAALDTESERAIQAALLNLSQGRTTLVIAHRLQTIEHADKICVVDHGRILEQGTHTELLSQSGIYAALAGQIKRAEAEL